MQWYLHLNILRATYAGSYSRQDIVEKMKAEPSLSDQRAWTWLRGTCVSWGSTTEFVRSGPAGLSTQPVRKTDAVVDEVKPAQPVLSSDWQLAVFCSRKLALENDTLSHVSSGRTIGTATNDGVVEWRPGPRWNNTSAVHQDSPNSRWNPHRLG